MRPLTKSYSMQPKWTDGRSTKKAVAEFIKPNDRLSSFERIEIYNKQYWFRLLDSLYEDFPGLRALLGDAKFHQLSIAYIDKHPSTSFTLRDLGQHMEKFLARKIPSGPSRTRNSPAISSASNGPTSRPSTAPNLRSRSTHSSTAPIPPRSS